MSTLKAKIEERKTKLDRVAALEKITKEEKRNWTAEELQEFETLEGELRTINEEITVLQAQERAAAISAARAAGTPVQGEFSEKEERDISKYSLRKVMLAKAENRTPDGIEGELHQEGIKERMNAGAGVSEGIIIPDAIMARLCNKLTKRAVTATGSSGAEGGHNIAMEVNGYQMALTERSLLLQLGAQYLTGLNGNFQMPRENAVFAPNWEGENDAAAASSPTYTKVTFSPKRLAGYMDVSKQLILQSSNDIERYLLEQILRGNAVALDLAGFAGAGGDAPTGILNDSDVLVTAIGANGGAITQAKLDEVDETIRGRKQYAPTSIVTNAKVRKVLRNLAIDSGSGLFVWDRRDNQIDGKNAYDTTHIPSNLVKGTSGAVCSALIEGVFSDVMFGQWGGVEILTDQYTQALNGMIRYVPNMYADFHVLRPASFQNVKDITTA